ncbi:hypothetical protein GBK04_02855 [Cytophagaceae bacterium SJW1-29]|uniref:PKD domain-containing protein n=1 Tax=Salmonirosea aquatica TaxID=2654236 RepID=A0A7C9FQT6_9BACT|nr:hypothetical protein [Cytophagaceae bacterium SJW1-29]
MKTCTFPTSVTTASVSKSTYTYVLVTASPADIKRVVWKVQQGSTIITQAEKSDTAAFSHTFATSGTYTINAEIETVCGEKTTLNHTTTTSIKTCILPSAITPVGVNSSTYRYTLMTATPADVKTVVWKVTNGATTLTQIQRADTSAFTYSYAAAGTYTVTADIESVCGEKITRTANTTVDLGISVTANFAAWKIGGANNDIGRSVVVDAAGNVYVVGTYASSFTFGATTMSVAGSNDIFIAKYNSRGDDVWIQRIASVNMDEVKDVVIDSSGDIFVTGEVSSNVGYYNSPDDVQSGNIIHKAVNGNSDAFLAKYTRDGKLVWFRTYGGNTSEVGTSIALHSSGIYLTGVFGASKTTFGSITLQALGTDGKYDMFLTKLSTNGDVLWAVSSGGFESDYASSIAVDSDGNVYMSGIFMSPGTFRSASGASAEHPSSATPDIFIAKYNSLGNLIAFHKGNSGTSIYGNSLAIYDGALYATGYVEGSKYGNLTVDYRGGGADIFLAKYDLNTLNVEWVKTAGSSGFDAGNKIVFDNAGNIYLAGLFRDNCHFGSTVLRSAGDSDAFLAQYDVNGNLRFVKSVGGPSADGYNALAVNSAGSLIYMVGFFGGTINIGGSSLSSSGGLDVLTTKYPD